MKINRPSVRRCKAIASFIVSTISFILILVAGLNDYAKFDESVMTNIHGANCYDRMNQATGQGEKWGVNPNDEAACNNDGTCLQLLSAFALNRNKQLQGGEVFVTIPGSNDFASFRLKSNASFIFFDGTENPPVISNVMHLILTFYGVKFLIASVSGCLSIYWAFHDEEVLDQMKESSKCVKYWLNTLPILIPLSVFVTSYVVSWMMNFDTYYYGAHEKTFSRDSGGGAGGFCVSSTWTKQQPLYFNATFQSTIDTSRGIVTPIEVSVSWSEGGMLIFFLGGTTAGLLFVGLGQLGLILATRNAYVESTTESKTINWLMGFGFASVISATLSPLIFFFIFVATSLDSIKTFDLTEFLTLNMGNVFNIGTLNTNTMSNIITTEFFTKTVISFVGWCILRQ